MVKGILPGKGFLFPFVVKPVFMPFQAHPVYLSLFSHNAECKNKEILKVGYPIM
jgi:hypothetical protein